MFPQSIEVQMNSGDAGDFWCIQENIEVADMEKRRPRKAGEKWGGAEGDARRILNLTDGSEKPLGEWNTMVIEARGRVGHGVGQRRSREQRRQRAPRTTGRSRSRPRAPRSSSGAWRSGRYPQRSEAGARRDVGRNRSDGAARTQLLSKPLDDVQRREQA